MIDALQLEFMRNALTAGLLVSLICGLIGTLVVVNRIVFISGGIAHAAYGGIGLAFFMGWPVMLSTVGFSLGAAILTAALTVHARHRADTVIGVVWALGMACGIILIDLTPGYQADLMSYLFGSILTVPTGEVKWMAAATVVIVAVVVFFYQEILASSFDEEFARTRGVRVAALYFVLVGLIALAVVMTIQVVGLILVIALLTIPPFIAEKFAGSVWQMMLLASGLGMAFTIGGLWLSFSYNLTSGAAIILVAGIGFVLSLLLEKLQRRNPTNRR